MFGFRGFGRIAKSETSVPAVERRPMVLISKEDIYRPAPGGTGGEPVLLLKKGHAVQPDELPRYIKNGARPSQFQLSYQDAEMAFETQPHYPAFQRSHLPGYPSHAASNPILDPDSLARAARARKSVLVLEPDQKSMKRLIDCLFVCGFNLDRIQPVRVAEHLEWAMEKYRPDILVVDYHLRRGTRNGIGVLQELRSRTCAERIILTLDPKQALGDLPGRLIRKYCEQENIGILPKPVSRFALSDVLESG